MNTIWLKIAAAAVVLVVVLAVISSLTSNDSAPTEAPSQEADSPKTVYRSWEGDDQEFGITDRAGGDPTAPPVAATDPVRPEPMAEPTFEELSLEEDIQAQRLHSMALNERKQSRLPGMTPKRMVDYCRQIIQRWPRSQYAFEARRMLADIPERYHDMYNITAEETDLSSFYK